MSAATTSCVSSSESSIARTRRVDGNYIRPCELLPSDGSVVVRIADETIQATFRAGRVVNIEELPRLATSSGGQPPNRDKPVACAAYPDDGGKSKSDAPSPRNLLEVPTAAGMGLYLGSIAAIAGVIGALLFIH